METAQIQTAGEDSCVFNPNNPFVPPKGGLCFINKLPPELLSHIFESDAADDAVEKSKDDSDNRDDSHDYPDCHYHRFNVNTVDDKDTHNNGYGIVSVEHVGNSPPPSRLPFPIVLCHVCHYWRNLVLANPTLWTRIQVRPVVGLSYELELMYLERSKSIPLEVHIDCLRREDHDYNVEPPSCVDLGPLLSALIPHVQRWRTMHVVVSDYYHMRVFLSAISDLSIHTASQLKKLELYHYDEFDSFEETGMSKDLIPFGGSVPSLTRLVLWGVHVDWDQPWITSASNLTDLELAFHPDSADIRPSWAQFASILRGAPALEKLSLRMSGPFGHPSDWFVEPIPGSPVDLNAPIPLLRLTDFVLVFYSEPRAIGLLHKLYLPAIKNLVLHFNFDDYTHFVHELVGPATSLSPAQEQPRSLLSRLESLHIAGLPCQVGCAEMLYSELENLTSLKLSLSCTLSPFFLDVLGTPCTLGDVWLPRLETLCVSLTSGDALRRIVQTRMDAGVPLHALYVERDSFMTEKDEEWLRQNLRTFKFTDGFERGEA